MLATNQNTTFFLGAGFSKAAGAPTQEEILSKVLNYHGADYENPVLEYQQKLRDFLTDAFGLATDDMHLFTLEDFYTPIDKCISENASFRGYSVDFIKQVRNELSILISIVIDSELVNFSINREFITDFVRFLCARNESPQEAPKAKVITTNWDILIDRRLSSEDFEFRRRINYGTEYYLISGDGVRPSERALSSFDGIELLKIHGSLNWCKCPSCNRLFISPISKIGIVSANLSTTCYFCETNYRLTMTQGKGMVLEPQIIYPTFLKDFSNVHFKNVWEKSAQALSQSRKLIFIGYSFPQADYELRQLLARKVPDNCEIIVVLHGTIPDRNDDSFRWTPEARYRNFFGRRSMTFHYSGAQEFIRNELPNL